MLSITENLFAILPETQNISFHTLILLWLAFLDSNSSGRINLLCRSKHTLSICYRPMNLHLPAIISDSQYLLVTILLTWIKAPTTTNIVTIKVSECY